jgi:hypothetical protein
MEKHIREEVEKGRRRRSPRCRAEAGGEGKTGAAAGRRGRREGRGEAAYTAAAAGTFQSGKIQNRRGEAKPADGEDLSALTCAWRAAGSRACPLKGNKAHLLVRLHSPEEQQPMPQLRDTASEKDKVSPVKDDGRAVTCGTCETEMEPGHQCQEQNKSEAQTLSKKKTRKAKETLCAKSSTTDGCKYSYNYCRCKYTF